MGFFWIIVLVLVGFWGASAWKQRGRPPSRRPSVDALEILKERYARGEISKEEYEEKKRALMD